MERTKISRTAIRVAAQRAAHQLLDSPLVLKDPVALHVLGEKTEKLLMESLERERLPGLQQARAFLVARSRLAEDTLAMLWKGGVRQYVVLGAGLDTFAYRNSLRGLKVFEVDSHATQRWKKKRLHKARVRIPGSLVFVPVDLEQEDLAVKLKEAGLRRSMPVFFSLLGVTAYLTPEATMNILRWISGFPAPGGVFFDYQLSPGLLADDERKTLESLAARAAKAGEPFKGFFDPGALVAELRKMGFNSVSDWGTKKLNSLYFPDSRKDFRITGELAHMVFAGKLKEDNRQPEEQR